jgi:hypothetical protein
MTQLDLRPLVADEPPIGVHVEQVLSRGAALRRGRRIAIAASALALSLGAFGVSALLSGTPGAGKDRLVVPGAQEAAAAPRDVAHPAGTLLSQRVHRSVLAHTDPALSFDVREEDGPHEGGIYGTVDDGQGKGSLYVSATTVPGNLQAHPCADPEFTRGMACTVTPLAEGAVLIKRWPARAGDVVDTSAEVLRADGTGLHAQVVNAWWPAMVDLPSGTRVTAEEKRAMATPTVTRAEPVLTLQQLADLLVAVVADVADAFPR